jgi:hypothetical protein
MNPPGGSSACAALGVLVTAVVMMVTAAGMLEERVCVVVGTRGLQFGADKGAKFSAAGGFEGRKTYLEGQAPSRLHHRYFQDLERHQCKQ